MKHQNPQPHWWALYLILPIFVLLAWIITRLALTGMMREIAQIGVIVLVFFLINRWITANEGYFASGDDEEPAVPSNKKDSLPVPVKTVQNPVLSRVGHALLAVFLVLAASWMMAFIGQNLLGGGVIAILYLVPVSWVTVRWGQLPGLSAALTAAMSFDFYFIPPYGTFQVGSLEGWLLLFLFTAVSVFVVGRMVRLYRSALRQEQDAAFLIDLVALLGNLRDREEIAVLLAESLGRYYQAGLVKVILYQRNGQPSILKVKSAKGTAPVKSLPGRTLPVLSGTDLVGEITIAQASVPLPGDDDPLLHSICRLVALAVDRVHPVPGGLKAPGNWERA